MSNDSRPGKLVHAEIPGERNITAADQWQIPRVGAVRSAPGGDRLVVPVTTWPGEKRKKLTRLWLMDADGSDCHPMTGEQASAAVPMFSPDGTRIAYTLNPQDDEKAKPQLHLLPLDGGEPQPLTEMPLGVLDVRWLPDGSGLVFVAKLIAGHATVEATQTELARREEDPVNVRATEKRLFRFWDQWLTGDEVPHFFHLDLATSVCRDLTPDSTAWLDFMSPTGQFDVAPDGGEIVYSAIVMNEDRNEIESRIFPVSLDGGEPECLTADAPAGTFRPRYSPEGDEIIYGRTEDRYFYADRTRLYRFDRASGKHEAWCDEWEQSPAQWEFSADGILMFVAESAARTHLYELALEDNLPTQLADGGSIGSPHVADDGSVYYIRQTFQHPPEVFQYAPGGPKPQRITHFTDEAMAGVAMGEVREIECEGAAGETVQSYVILPPGHIATAPAPFINVVHGGPHGVWGDEFHFRWNAQLFAASGRVVAYPNFQGSTSWGNEFSQRIQGEWATRPFADVMAVTDHLIDSGLVDGKRMAAIGGSYGGYMMAWIAGHTDRFRCLVNHAGVYNTLSMYASDATQGRGRSFGGEPWSGLEAIDSSNPARYTADMVTPMLVIHGEKDYRVPVTQGLECYGVLQAKGVPARLLHFPDENHWVLKPHNSIRWYAEVLDWIGRWVQE